MDLARNIASRFTFDPADDTLPLWSPDGTRLFFSSSREGVQQLYQALSDRPGSEELLLRSGAWKAPDDVSSDGRFLIYETIDPKTLIDLWLLPLSGDRTPEPFVATPFDEYGAQFSPDGRWVAYVSNESGRGEISVQAFPGPGGKWQVSSGGGTMPRWRKDGRELFFLGADGQLMAAEVRLSPSFDSRVPTALFKVSVLESPDWQYDVSPDGTRILVNRVSRETEATPMTVGTRLGRRAGGTMTRRSHADARGRGRDRHGGRSAIRAVGAASGSPGDAHVHAPLRSGRHLLAGRTGMAIDVWHVDDEWQRCDVADSIRTAGVRGARPIHICD